MTRVTTAVVGGLVTALLTAAPAWASDPVGPREGADPGKGLGVAATLLLYVVIPLGSMVVLAAVVLLPGAVRSHRYRPAEGWGADAVWFAGPVDPAAAVAAAVASADRGALVRGGAHGSW